MTTVARNDFAIVAFSVLWPCRGPMRAQPEARGRSCLRREIVVRPRPTVLVKLWCLYSRIACKVVYFTLCLFWPVWPSGKAIHPLAADIFLQSKSCRRTEIVNRSLNWRTNRREFHHDHNLVMKLKKIKNCLMLSIITYATAVINKVIKNMMNV
jgi:hypothetical protein